MNNFAEIVFIQRFEKVCYYSLSINDEEMLFGQFLSKHTISNREKLNHILEWIKIIGDKYGTKAHFFRNESETADTSALPPIGRNREPVYVEITSDGDEQITANNLRLYCMRLNDYVVFLFNGDVKSTLKAQDCNNVKSHFQLANRLSALIDKALINKEIKWTPDFTDIMIEDDFRLMW